MKKREAKLCPMAKAVLGPMAKLLPKPMMKPVKAWALVRKNGIVFDVWMGPKKRGPYKCVNGERIARVVITEAVKG